jgi:CDP-4-dehydro-6-deoxyglucose reductase, E3
VAAWRDYITLSGVAEKVARVASNTTIAPDVLIVDARFVDPPSLSWRAGQFISVRCGDASRKPNERRSYSIASSPTRPDGLDLLVKLIPGGLGSELFRHLAPGDEIRFTGPMGFFTCELRHPGDAVFAATGSGIAAALPMIQETLARPDERGRVLLYWGMRHERDLYWVDQLEALKSPRFRYEICMSQPSPVWTGTRGRINAHVLAAAPALERPIFYLVGHGDMVRDVKNALVAMGMDRKRQIRNEVFYPETKAAS